MKSVGYWLWAVVHCKYSNRRTESDTRMWWSLRSSKLQWKYYCLLITKITVISLKNRHRFSSNTAVRSLQKLQELFTLFVSYSLPCILLQCLLVLSNHLKALLYFNFVVWFINFFNIQIYNTWSIACSPLKASSNWFNLICCMIKVLKKIIFFLHLYYFNNFFNLIYCLQFIYLLFITDCRVQAIVLTT